MDKHTAHTPGPWMRTPHDNVVHPDRAGWADESAIAVCVSMGTRTQGEARANADLISAAPELLEAIRSLAFNAGALMAFEYEIRDAAGNTNWQCLMDAVADARAAIAKATGGAA